VKPLKTVIHVHTTWSRDANLTPAELLAACGRESVDCVAITDHDEIDGALETRRLADASGAAAPRIIIGEEVSTRDGHLIGLFLQRRIEPGRSAEETIAEIRSQGGLVLAPHPFATLCANSLHGAVHRIAAQLDAVEIHNAQNPLAWEDRRAAEFARTRHLPAYVGADCHLRGVLAPAFQRLPGFEGAREFLGALRRAELTCGRFGLGYMVRMAVRDVWDKLMPHPLPGFATHMRSSRRGAALRGRA
jgi:hypothetical protein